MKILKLKYFIIIVIAGFTAYHSVYFRQLDEVQQQQRLQDFDAGQFAKEFWNETLLSQKENAPDIVDLLSRLKSDFDRAAKQYGHTLGVSNVHAFLVKGSGTIADITDENVIVQLPNNTQVEIATRYIFGNAIRDASSQLDVSDFPSTMEFNTISNALNSIVKNRVVSPFLERAQVGQKIDFFAATEIDSSEKAPNRLRLIPIQIEMQN